MISGVKNNLKGMVNTYLLRLSYPMFSEISISKDRYIQILRCTVRTDLADQRQNHFTLARNSLKSRMYLIFSYMIQLSTINILFI